MVLVALARASNANGPSSSSQKFLEKQGARASNDTNGPGTRPSSSSPETSRSPFKARIIKLNSKVLNLLSAPLLSPGNHQPIDGRVSLALPRTTAPVDPSIFEDHIPAQTDGLTVHDETTRGTQNKIPQDSSSCQT